jgi:YVTN family beta-propeller protein
VTVYAFSDPITVINAATNTVRKPLSILNDSSADELKGSSQVAVAQTPRGITAYVIGETRTASSVVSYVVPVDVASDTAGSPIHVSGGGVAVIAASPDGKTVYAVISNGYGQPGAVMPIDTATNTPGTLIDAAHQEPLQAILVAPGGKTVYVVDQSGDLTPVNTATNTAGVPVKEPGEFASGDDMVITPDGKTIYIADYGDNEVVPFDTATQTMEKPITATYVSRVAVIP